MQTHHQQLNIIHQFAHGSIQGNWPPSRLLRRILIGDDDLLGGSESPGLGQLGELRGVVGLVLLDPRSGVSVELGLGLVVSEVKGHVLKRVGRILGPVSTAAAHRHARPATPYLGLGHEPVHQIAQVPLVLRLVVKHLTRHLDNLLRGVVAGARKLDQLVALNDREPQIHGRKLDHNLGLGRVLLAHVGGVAEAQRRGIARGHKRLCELYNGAVSSQLQMTTTTAAAAGARRRTVAAGQ